MERETASQTSRWALRALVGVVTFSWVVMPTVSVPTVPGAALAFAATRVTGVELGAVGPKSVVVVIKTDRQVESYESFALPDPPRVVIDIPDAVHAAPTSLRAGGPVKEIRSSQYRTKPVKVVRIVLDLRSKLPYQIETIPGELQVAIGEATLVAERSEAPAIAQAAPEVEPTEELPTPSPLGEGQVHGVEYRPQDGLAEILVRTSGEVTFDVSETTTPPALIVKVTDAELDPSAAKVLDVRQLPGPVQRIRTTQQSFEPDKVVRIAADLKGKVLHQVTQTPDGITLSLRETAAVAAPAPAAPVPAVAEPAPVTPAPVAPAPPPVPVAPVAVAPPVEAPVEAEIARLSMDFKDADVNNLLRIIAEVSGQNIVAGEDVKGKVTVRLVDVPWDRALDNILRINGLGFVREDNIIRVAKLDAIRKERDARRKELLEEIKLEEEAAIQPLTTEILRVSYADAKKVVENLNKIKSKRGSISVDDRTASLLVQDTETNIEKMRVVLRELDQPTPQVMIEARIVTVDSDHTRSLGIEWGFQNIHNDVNKTSNAFVLSEVFGNTGSTIAAPAAVAGTSPAVTAGLPAAVNTPIAGPAGAIGFVLGKVNDTFRLQARLTALEQENITRTLSTPRIVALDNEEAIIKQGEEIPFTTVDSSGRTTVTFKEAVLSLTVTPHVTADRRISLKVKATDDSKGDEITFAGGFAFAFNRNEATSSLLVDNGTTVVIGGVRSRTENVNEKRVPFLGTIPVLGWLFKSRTENLKPSTTELLIFITPTILEPSMRG
ncbi:MAG: type IV pilus secretin PilQ [Candidatus Methylomirabilales bacterium]